MANSTTIDMDNIFLFCYIGYIVVGLNLVVCNGLIIATVFRFDQLRSRKEYLVMTWVALADFFYGVGYCIGGPMRAYMILTKAHMVLKTSWECLMMPYNLIWVWAEPASYILLMSLSIDRIQAVALPITYFKYTTSYAIKLGSVLWGTAFFWALLAVIFSRVEPPVAQYEAICFSSWATGKTFSFYNRSLPVYCAIGSVVLYCFVPVLYKRKQPKVAPTTNSKARQNQSEKMFQRKVTITMGVAALCTAVFVLFPKVVHFGIVLFYDYNVPNEADMVLIPILYLVPHLNSVCNFVLYVRRHKHFRKALLAMLKCKQLPANFCDH